MPVVNGQYSYLLRTVVIFGFVCIRTQYLAPTISICTLLLIFKYVGTSMYIGPHTCMSGYVSAYHGVRTLCILLHTILCRAVRYISWKNVLCVKGHVSPPHWRGNQLQTTLNLARLSRLWSSACRFQHLTTRLWQWLTEHILRLLKMVVHPDGGTWRGSG